MKKLLVCCLFVIFSTKISFAHNPLSAMYFLEVEDDFGILNVSLSQVGLQEAVFKNYKKEDISNLSEVEYKQIIVKYVKHHFHITINGDQIKLLEGGVKLGNHQTDLKFVTAKLPDTFMELSAKIDAFRENEHHQTIFSLSLNHKTSKVILSENNNYTASVYFEGNRMVIYSDSFKKNYLWFFVIVPVFMLAKKALPHHKKRLN